MACYKTIMYHRRHLQVVLFFLAIAIVNAQRERAMTDISGLAQAAVQQVMANPDSPTADILTGVTDFIDSPAAHKAATRAAGLLSNGLEAYLDNLNYNVSAVCLSHTEMILQGLVNRERWALRMIDAMGKPRSDILELHLVWLGTYDECVDTKAVVYPDPAHKENPTSPFKGRYCKTAYNIGHAKPGNPYAPALTIGLCVPDSCSADDVTALANTLTSLIPVNASSLPEPHTVCQLEDMEYSTKAIAVLSVCGALIAIIVAGTIYDIVISISRRTNTDKKVDSLSKYGTPPGNEAVVCKTITKLDGSVVTNGVTVHGGVSDVIPLISASEVTVNLKADKSITTEEFTHGILGNILVSFSLYTNLGKILNTSQPAGTLTAVHGIRFISMSWVILGHALSDGLAAYEQNMVFYMPEMFHRLTFQVVGNATFSVDTFFCLSGLLVAYLSMKEMQKVGGAKNFKWGMFYFHRFWRLTPPYMLVLMVYVPTMKYWNNGPLWNQQGPHADECEDTWWWNMLYINNLVDPARQCMGYCWYLANDMQFYIVSPLMLIPLYYSRLWGSLCCLAFVLDSVISSGVISSVHDLNSNLVFGIMAGSRDYHDLLYVNPWCRIGPYAVGIFTGYLLYKTNCRIRLRKCSSGSDCADTQVDLWLHWWKLSPMNTFLSWPAFIPLSRLSYCAYLIHPLIMMTYFWSKRSLLYVTDLEMAYIYTANLCINYAIALVVSLAFEAPMMGLEKAILGRGRRKS